MCLLKNGANARVAAVTAARIGAEDPRDLTTSYKSSISADLGRPRSRTRRVVGSLSSSSIVTSCSPANCAGDAGNRQLHSLARSPIATVEREGNIFAVKQADGRSRGQCSRWRFFLFVLGRAGS